MLDSRQRAPLRALANPIESLFQVGKAGLLDSAAQSFDDALEARELIKVHVLKTTAEDIHSIADTLAARVGADVVSVVGRRVVLYRASARLRKEGRSIRLP